MAKTIIVTLNPEDASFSVDLNGFQGKGCDAILKAFEGLGTVTKTIHKPEYKATKLAAKTVNQ